MDIVIPENGWASREFVTDLTHMAMWKRGLIQVNRDTYSNMIAVSLKETESPYGWYNTDIDSFSGTPVEVIDTVPDGIARVIPLPGIRMREE
jgi:hypothetical protein